MRNPKATEYMAKYADLEWIKQIGEEILTWHARNISRRNHTLKELRGF